MPMVEEKEDAKIEPTPTPNIDKEVEGGNLPTPVGQPNLCQGHLEKLERMEILLRYGSDLVEARRRDLALGRRRTGFEKGRGWVEKEQSSR